jgi:hypothetical protein
MPVNYTKKIAASLEVFYVAQAMERSTMGRQRYGLVDGAAIPTMGLFRRMEPAEPRNAASP